jgi:hypothetical protein
LTCCVYFQNRFIISQSLRQQTKNQESFLVSAEDYEAREKSSEDYVQTQKRAARSLILICFQPLWLHVRLVGIFIAKEKRLPCDS